MYHMVLLYEDCIPQARAVYHQKPLDQPPNVGISFVKLAWTGLYNITLNCPNMAALYISYAFDHYV